MADVTTTEGDLLRAALAKAGRQAFLGGDGGMSDLILAVAPALPGQRAARLRRPAPPHVRR